MKMDPDESRVSHLDRLYGTANFYANLHELAQREKATAAMVEGITQKISSLEKARAERARALERLRLALHGQGTLSNEKTSP